MTSWTQINNKKYIFTKNVNLFKNSWFDGSKWQWLYSDRPQTETSINALEYKAMVFMYSERMVIINAFITVSICS